MRARLPIATLLALLTLAAPAAATDHRMTVAEVATSMGGTMDNQFVELLDPADEPFPFPAGYRLAVYDAEGVSFGSQSLGRGAALVDAGAPMLVAKGNVGATPHVPLALTLPREAGQACFERGDGSRVHCLRWGTIVIPVGTIATRGPAPGNDQSLQICAGEAKLGTPNPRAANTCTGATTRTQVGPPRDRTPPTVAVSVPSQTLGGVRRRGLRVRVRSSETSDGVVRILRNGRQVGAVARLLTARRTRTIAVPLTPAARRALRNASSATFVVRVRVTDGGANRRDVTRRVRVPRALR